MKQEILQALLEWNPWLEGTFPNNLLGIKREYNILSFLDIAEIKILVGSRRTGKSTLLYKVIKERLEQGKHVLYVNFQDETLSRYSLAEIYYEYLEKGPINDLILDEVQYCTDWIHFVRKLYDTKKCEQIWITGSHSKLVKEEYAEMLTGRNLTLSIAPLSFREFLHFKKIDQTTLPFSREAEAQVKAQFSEFLKHGAYPAVTLRTVYQTELLQNYFEDIVYKDIATRHNVNVKKLKEFGIYLATNSAKPYSNRKLGQLFGVHPNTISDYLSYFEDVYFMSSVNRFDFSLKKQISNEKKIYLIDHGLARAISFKFSQDFGRVLESVVYSALKRKGIEIYYHKGKKECDFVIKKETEIIDAIQVCAVLDRETNWARERDGLMEAMKLYGLKEGFILTMDEEKTVTEKGLTIHIQPVWKWLLEG